MPTKRKTDFKRWTARIELSNAGTIKDDIVLTGIVAPDKQTANARAWEKAVEFMGADESYTRGGCRIVELAEETLVPSKGTSFNTQKQYKANGATSVAPYTPPKPFQCPIVNLCKSKHLGRISGTTAMAIKDWEEAKDAGQ